MPVSVVVPEKLPGKRCDDTEEEDDDDDDDDKFFGHFRHLFKIIPI